MNSGLKNSIRALILLIVFSLNTVIGFACSIGIDLGFNSGHHDGSKPDASVHIHKDGKRHIHHENKNHDSQTKQSGHHHSAEKKEGTKTDDKDCCSDDVVQFEKLDKSIPNSGAITYPLFLTDFVYIFYAQLLPTSDIIRNIKQFVRSYHPPISDIRIAIRSFQI